ncbi:MAG: hypothetical protein IPP74_06795 [Alphaproteobacteria bacterium]|nr:hypothetical protein [Alphaproteobacteria bacterium]
MKNNHKKGSLSLNYFLIFSCMFCVVFVLSTIYVLSLYQSRKTLKDHALFRSAHQIGQELQLSFDYVNNLLVFLGEKILENDPHNLPQITELLQGRLVNNDSIRDQFSWAMFDWSTPDKQMRASTPWGIMKKPKDISHRYYAHMAFKEPWKMHFDKRDIGISSGQLIIPAGMGITHADGTPAGILSLGFQISRISQRFEQILGTSNISFIIIDGHHAPAIQSADIENNAIHDHDIQLALHKIPQIKGYHPLSTPLILGDTVFLSYYAMEHYPFIILVGYNRTIFYQELREVLLPGIIGFATIGGVSLLLLWLLRYQIIAPTLELSKAAELLSRNVETVIIPKPRARELRVLARQLVNVKRHIKKIHRVEKQLIHAKIEAEKANYAKSKFLANMSHELRTPLVTINGYSEFLTHKMYGSLDPRYVEAGGYINTAGNHLLHLINEILDLSKIEAGKMEMDEQPFDFNRLLKTCCSYIKETARKKQIEISTETPDNPPALYADQLRIKQILLNLLSNAVKFTPEKGHIFLKFYVRDGALFFEITDTGIGIAEENIPLILSEFGQIYQEGYEKATEGTGLGLPISKRLVELHQGTFTLTSTLNVGTTIIIRFPPERLR